MNANPKDEPQDMGFLKFLLEISYRPPNIIFMILGFLLVFFGWTNLYAEPSNSVHLGNLFVGIIGAILLFASILIEFNIRSGKWRHESNPKV